MFCGLQKKKAVATVATTRATATTTTSRSKFAEFRRQMKLKQKTSEAVAPAADDDVTGLDTGSQQPVVALSPSMPSPRRRSTNSGWYDVI